MYTGQEGHIVEGMSDQTLQGLVQRRLRELGGLDGKPMSAYQLWLKAGGNDVWSHETVRRIAYQGHHKIGDKVAEALAVGLDVPLSKILEAAGQRPRLSRFQLPRRADRLTDKERRAVVGIIDAILDAREAGEPDRATKQK